MNKNLEKNHDLPRSSVKSKILNIVFWGMLSSVATGEALVLEDNYNTLYKENTESVLKKVINACGYDCPEKQVFSGLNNFGNVKKIEGREDS